MGPLFSTDPSTENSRRASFQKTERGSRIVDTNNLPKGLSVWETRRGSQVIIDDGKRWEYKPSIKGPMILADGWSMAPVRFGGATYFVPSPPGSKWQSRRGSSKYRKGPRRKPGRRGSTGKISKRRKKKQQAADKKAAEALIRQIKAEEKRSSTRSKSAGRKKRGKTAPRSPSLRPRLRPPRSKRRARKRLRKRRRRGPPKPSRRRCS